MNNEDLIEAIEDLRETQRELTEAIGSLVELAQSTAAADIIRHDESKELLEEIRNGIQAQLEAGGQP